MNLFPKTMLSLALSACMIAPALANPTVSVSRLSTYTEACSDESCAEISAFDADSSRVFTTNSEENELRILNVDEDGKLAEVDAIDLRDFGGGPNSVAVSNGYVAVAMEADDKQADGTVELFDTDGNHLQSIAAGALPDMVTFTPDGNYLIVANEGEPSDDYTVDPEGSVTVIDTSSWPWLPTQVNFNAFDDAKLKDVRVFGPNASVSQDLEPEYVAVSADSTTAWIALQENNALAKLDIASATITDIYGLGYKRHDQKRNAFDASNEDGGINIQTWPTLGMYQPDAITTYQRGDATFILSANEGDARDYWSDTYNNQEDCTNNGGLEYDSDDGCLFFSEETRVKDLTLDPEIFPNAEELQEKPALGRLKTTLANGDTDGDGDHDEIYSYGARSFSIWNSNGKQVFDSGSQFEDMLAKLVEDQGKNVWVEKRSDDKGPEPESITVGQFGDEHYAFIGLERASGIFIYNISSPSRPTPAGYINVKEKGDIGPEGLTFIPRSADTGWLLVTSEISNTVSVYEVTID